MGASCWSNSWPGRAGRSRRPGSRASTSAITAIQSTAARSAGVRATSARKRARYERMKRTKSAAENARPLIHVVGRGNPLAAAGLPAIAIAVSRHARAAFMTSDAPLNGGISSGGTDGTTIAAESYARARLPSEIALAKNAKDRARAFSPAEPSDCPLATSRSRAMIALAAVRLFFVNPLKSRRFSADAGLPRAFEIGHRGRMPRTCIGTVLLRIALERHVHEARINGQGRVRPARSRCSLSRP